MIGDTLNSGASYRKKEVVRS